jgi:phosphoserine aminotransferase
VVTAYPTIPASLLPADGRFGSGPSKVPTSTVAAFSAQAGGVLGTSHRQPPVKALIRTIRDGLTTLFALPAGYEVVLGNGGATLFWDAAAFSLIRQRSQHCAFGEFSAKFAAVAAGAPFLAEPTVRRADAGSAVLPVHEDSVDVYCWPHNETSTGVSVPVSRPAGGEPDQLCLVDGTSAAAGIALDPAECDVYYFAPQKGFAGDGGLWIGLFSPAALARTAEIARSGRWLPPTLDLSIAVDNSRKDQTYNTPAVGTLWLLAHEVSELVGLGGLAYSTARTAESSARLYGWAEKSDFATPFVADPALRSPVVGTIDFDPSVDAKALAAALRANGIVDTEPYRGLQRNQLRIGMFPAVDPDDVGALTACIDHLVPLL